ncbi:MAG: transketolase [Candidatus Omnitrophica bacterium]|nr:transketolase [Candidatus Omnitrophota bacterium]
MEQVKQKTMRDAFLEQLYNQMQKREDLFFVSADFGSPVLDKIRTEFKNNFINVGIAEQNLINVATGLALEGFIVYAYAIAPFLSMRAYEQIRTNLALLSQIKQVNVNLIGVGAGLSYDVSGPTHHCLEDITLMRLLPNIMLFSPADWVTAKCCADFSIDVKQPKYLRFDAKPLPAIYADFKNIDMEKGFCELKKGNDVCFVSTGYMTHRALELSGILLKDGINCGIIDIFMLKPFDEKALQKAMKKYRAVIALEESFGEKGGLDSILFNLISGLNKEMIYKNFGFADKYVFELGSRKELHEQNGLSDKVLLDAVKKCLN